MTGKVFFSVTMSLDGFMAPRPCPSSSSSRPKVRTTRGSSAG